MRKKSIIESIVLVVLMALMASCCHKKDEHILIGHWGCDTYISCRTDDEGAEQWDTLTYEVGTGHGYEMFFRSDNSAEFKMNDSPALIKKITGTFELDEENQQVLIYPAPMYAAFLPDARELIFEIETLEQNTLTVYWTNVISEDKPFYEHFNLQKIE